MPWDFPYKPFCFNQIIHPTFPRTGKASTFNDGGGSLLANGCSRAWRTMRIGGFFYGF
jgi:hypothetical protein